MSSLISRSLNRSAARSRYERTAAERRAGWVVGVAAIMLAIALLVAGFEQPALADDSPEALWATRPAPAGVVYPAAAAQPPASSPQALWPRTAAVADTDSPQALWPRTAAAPAADTDAPQSLWAQRITPGAFATADDSPPDLWADENKTQAAGGSPDPLWPDNSASAAAPSVAAPADLTPSQTFWASVDRGYRRVKPFGGKGYPGWGPGACFQPAESAFYTRLDFYHWTEHYAGSNLLDERGPMYTVGYTHTGGEQRLRLEVFSGVVQYQGATFGGSGGSLLLDSQTTYYGGRIEYDLFFNCPNHPNCLLFLGLGLRSWHRALPSTTIGSTFVQGYGETWVTLYPYIGLETRHDPNRVWEFYGRMRVGITAFTRNHAGPPLNTGVNPLVGATALLEEGIRWRDFSLTAWAEAFGFSQSHITNDLFQPTSTLLTVGVKAAYSF